MRQAHLASGYRHVAQGGTRKQYTAEQRAKSIVTTVQELLASVLATRARQLALAQAKERFEGGLGPGNAEQT